MTPSARRGWRFDGGENTTTMRQAVMYAPGDVRVEQRDRPALARPTDAVIRVAALLRP
ncbi:hypothetical protein Aca07nite_66230 [Actinoplanes capillaceus]|uniref:Uncharacterized protein n=1 Tax=Actinoplanes campanulatus TaxID=113559 RepID=A0ABQ3WST0_9ACTN|nr:hypothetical protein Aca07nite_66230 [Actinoplanes capillaceus]